MLNTEADLSEIQVVIALIKNKQQHYLIEQRNREAYPGYWGLPGGKVDSNETHQQALHRELSEELAIDVTKSQFCHKTQVISKTGKKEKLIVSLWCISTYQGQISAKEGQILRWVNQEALLASCLFPATSHLLLDYFSLR